MNLELTLKKFNLIEKMEHGQEITKSDLQELGLFNDKHIALLLTLDRIALKLKLSDVLGRKAVEWY